MVNSPIKAEDLATEFSVVRNEFEMGENSPEAVLSQRMAAVAFEWHNYGKSTIGNRTDIERVPVDNLRAFYKKFYQPDNAMLVVAGKFDEKKALEYIDKYFGAMPRPDRKLPATYTEEPPQDGERVVTLRRVGDVGLVGLLYHIPAGPHPEFPPCRCWPSILGSEPSGRLYKALVETKKAVERLGSAQALHDPGMFEIMAEVNTKDLAALEKVRDVMYSVARRGRPRRASRRRRSIAPGRGCSRTASSPPPTPTGSPSSSRTGPRRATGGSTSSTATGSRRSRPAEVQGGRRQVPDARATAPSASSSPAPSPSGRRSRRRPTSPSWSRATRAARCKSAGESFDVSPAGHRGPRPAARPDRGGEARLPAQEDARRGRPRAPEPALRHGREPQGQGRGRRASSPA